jgi:hypothetical protein
LPAFRGPLSHPRAVADPRAIEAITAQHVIEVDEPWAHGARAALTPRRSVTTRPQPGGGAKSTTPPTVPTPAIQPRPLRRSSPRPNLALLVLGQDALNSFQGVLDAERAELNTWEDVTVSTGFNR